MRDAAVEQALSGVQLRRGFVNLSCGDERLPIVPINLQARHGLEKARLTLPRHKAKE